MSAPIESIEQVLTFWFGEPTADGAAPPEVKKRWWTKDPAFDDQVKQQFEPTVKALLAGELDDRANSARGLLSMILCLDQFTRNMYRGTAGAFSGDGRALELARTAVDRGFDAELTAQQKMFLYMPFMHAEDVSAQNRCVELFERMVEADGEQWQGNLDYAVQHRDIVAQFDCFPHRNEMLGRETTPEQAEFLEKPGSSF